MDQAVPCYCMLSIFIVLVSYSTEDIICEHSCLSNESCNYKQIQDTCYYIFKDKHRNWFNSRQFCIDQGLSMVKLTRNMIEQTQMNNSSGFFNDMTNGLLSDKENRTNAWLGGRALDLNAWTFLNNIKAVKKGLKLPSSSDIEYTQCGAINKTKNKFEIKFNGCGSPLPFICRLGQAKWHVVSENKSWFEARSYCIGLGGDLFYLDNNETLEIFERSANITGHHHIGLRHRVWEWIDGLEINFSNWAPGEPNKLSEKCLLLYVDSGKWNNDDCYEDKLTFCQRDAANDNSQVIPIIILGSLLGVFFIITISLIIFIVCIKCTCKSSYEDTEIIENNYYSVKGYGQSLATLSNGKLCTSPSSIDSTVEYSYDASTAKETNGGSDFASNKPVIKPKPIIGPKTGDVYSTVDKSNCLPVKPQDTNM